MTAEQTINLKESYLGCYNSHRKLFNFEFYKLIIEFIKYQIDNNQITKTRTEQKQSERILLLFLILYLTNVDLSIILQMRQYHLHKLLQLSNSNNKHLSYLDSHCFIEGDKTIGDITDYSYYTITFNCLFNTHFHEILVSIYETKILKGEYMDRKKSYDFVFSTLSDDSSPLKKSNAIKELKLLLEEFYHWRLGHPYLVKNAEDEEAYQNVKKLVRVKITDLVHSSI